MAHFALAFVQIRCRSAHSTLESNEASVHGSTRDASSQVLWASIRGITATTGTLLPASSSSVPR